MLLLVNLNYFKPPIYTTLTSDYMDNDNALPWVHEPENSVLKLALLDDSESESVEKWVHSYLANDMVVCLDFGTQVLCTQWPYHIKNPSYAFEIRIRIT